MMQRCARIFFSVADGAFAWSTFSANNTYDAVPSEGRRRSRSLRLDHHPVDPGAPQNINGTTMTVYLTQPRPGQNPAQSIFRTDILRRYGSGSFDFRVVERAPCDLACSQVRRLPWGGIDAPRLPCLVATMGDVCRFSHLACNYPECRYMVTNDEKCARGWYHVRQYYSADIKAGYLPLGPRLDTWTSLRNMQQNPEFFIKPASERRYAFNAIFSQSTHIGRINLAHMINSRMLTERLSPGSGGNLTVYARMAKKWYADVNNRWTEQLDTNSYMMALLDSVFTLSPAGRNPECFRLYEAVEAGSTPVLSVADLGYGGRGSRCRGALDHWREASVLILESWDDLYPTVGRMIEDVDGLNQMQVELRTWYDEHMRDVVVGFEDYMIESYMADGDATEGVP